MYYADYEYGYDKYKRTLEIGTMGSPVRKFTYLSNYIKQEWQVPDREHNFISGRDGVFAEIVFEDGNPQPNIVYIHTNYLGSVQVITDQNGNKLEEYAFDPWGKMRDPDDWSLDKDPNSCIWFEYICYRGYTGHEYLPEFELIDMKARLYDPVVGQFLSPDNYVQAPEYSQNFNRYAYCLNNPMKYTDPSGDFFFSALPGVGAIINAACWGAVWGAGTSAISYT